MRHLREHTTFSGMNGNFIVKWWEFPNAAGGFIVDFLISPSS